MHCTPEILKELRQLNPDGLTDQNIRLITRIALTLIEPIYYEYPTVQHGKKIGERVFAYEFYHQLRTLFSVCSYHNITGEPIKGAGVIADHNETIIPDLVVHKYGVNESNKIAIEIKLSRSTSTKSILEDLLKLHRMTTGILNYRFGIFICGNFSFGDKILSSRKYKKEIIDTVKNNDRLEIWNIVKPKLNHGECPMNLKRVLHIRSENIDNILENN